MEDMEMNMKNMYPVIVHDLHDRVADTINKLTEYNQIDLDETDLPIITGYEKNGQIHVLTIIRDGRPHMVSVNTRKRNGGVMCSWGELEPRERRVNKARRYTDEEKKRGLLGVPERPRRRFSKQAT